MKLLGGKKRIIVLFSDVILTVVSYWLAYLLRFNFVIPEVFVERWLESLPVLAGIRILCFSFLRLYSGVWRYASMSDLVRILQAVTLSSLLFAAYILFAYQYVGYPRSVLVIDWFVITIFVGGSRFLYRLSREVLAARNGSENKKRVLIIGAGNAGEMLLREMKQNPHIPYDPVGFLDDNPDKHGLRIHNVPVLGTVEDAAKIARKKGAGEIVVAIPSLTGKQMRKIIRQCESAGVSCKTVPAIGDILNGKVSVNQIRQINIEDLLGREHIELNKEQIREFISNRRVMVTGGAGSIGQELCRQILRNNPQQLIILERVENELFYLEHQFAKSFPGAPYVTILGDILDASRLEAVMQQYSPEVVFHAAAYKHVPMMESHPAEAVKNNILGTLAVAESAVRHGVEKFVMISTDKAVKPSSVMGASKRIAELICQGLNRKGKARFVVVRFGNVLNSAGSVIPLFKQQIEKGGPVTVTHPDATRYFMSIPEAAQLVMQAGAMGSGGEIFVLDMGEPVKITDLATDMIRLMGFKAGEDIDIVFSGLRPGEKVHEELVTDEEESEHTSHEKITVVRSPGFDWADLNGRIEKLVKEMDQYTATGIREALMSMIPENSHPSR